MERRLLVVFALTFLVIMLFQPLLKKYGPQPPAKPESENAAGLRPAGQPGAAVPTQNPSLPARVSPAHGAATETRPAPSLQVATSEQVCLRRRRCLGTEKLHVRSRQLCGWGADCGRSDGRAGHGVSDMAGRVRRRYDRGTVRDRPDRVPVR